MNEFQKLKKESYSPQMTLREQAMTDKEKVKRKRHTLKKKHYGEIPQLRMVVYASTKEKLLNQAQIICKNKEVPFENFRYIGIVN